MEVDGSYDFPDFNEGGFLDEPCLGGGYKYFYFHPYLGSNSNFDQYFQMGWNHQRDVKFPGVSSNRSRLLWATMVWIFHGVFHGGQRGSIWGASPNKNSRFFLAES